MNSIEEKLWDYIDGSCSPEEQEAIARLIAVDDVYHDKYHELLKLNQEFSAIELDEPPMAFTYKVMENIRTDNARQPLKAAINKRIIWAFAAFFVTSIVLFLIIAIGSVNWSSVGGSSIDIKLPEIKLPQVNSYLSGIALKGFLFFDVVIGLFLADIYLRRKAGIKQQ